MKIKLGIDITYIPKFEKLMKNKSFISKTFSKQEIKNPKDYNPKHLAGIFAAKEAFFKAINKGQTIRPKWHDIEIKKQKNKKPVLLISNDLKKKAKIQEVDLSISHDKDYAIAAIICIIK